MVKNPALIVSDEPMDKSRVVVIRRKNPDEDRDTKLGDVFEFLPSGLILKEETGIGATTMELNSRRNSIIVEPIKITASSKAHKHNALYVGSETRIHKKKVKDSDIVKYITSDSTEWKKIIVVADSLERIIKIVGESLYEDYFFMIDEIDSFQLDSSYRASMENCLDVYKKFQIQRRAMVSATYLKFSDPLLVQEPTTFIKYDEPAFRTIELFHTKSKIKGIAVKRIGQILEQHPGDKIMVAFNSVSGCFDLASHLHKKQNIPDQDIKILCSSNSKDKIGSYYAELDSDMLPSKVNFVTSAYFTGFDLHEQYHLISISANEKNSHNNIYSLSDKRIKQIAGRCRDPKGLLSESIIYNTTNVQAESATFDGQGLIKAAEKEIAALNCIKRHYNDHPLLRATIKTIRELVTQNTASNGYKFVRMKNEEPLISYLNIDAYLEMVNVQTELYSSGTILPKILLEAGHRIHVRSLKGEEEVENNAIEKKSRSVQLKSIIERLRALDKAANPLELRNDINNPLSYLQDYTVRNYANLHAYIDREHLLTLIEKASEQRDRRMLNNLFFGAYYFTLDPETHYKRLVNFHIPLGITFSGEQLLERWNTIFLESGLPDEIDTPVQAIRFTKLHFKAKKKRGTGGLHTIGDVNPFDLELIQPRPFKEERRINKPYKKKDKSPVSHGKSLLKGSYKPLHEDDFPDEPEALDVASIKRGKSLMKFLTSTETPEITVRRKEPANTTGKLATGFLKKKG